MALSRQSAAFMENIKVLTYTSIALGKLDDEEVSGCKAETFQLYLQCLRDNLARFKVDKTEKYWNYIITNGGIALLKLTKIYGVQILLFPLVFPWRRFGDMSKKDIKSAIMDKEFWEEYIDAIEPLYRTTLHKVKKNLEHWYKDIMANIPPKILE